MTFHCPSKNCTRDITSDDSKWEFVGLLDVMFPGLFRIGDVGGGLDAFSGHLIVVLGVSKWETRAFLRNRS